MVNRCWYLKESKIRTITSSALGTRSTPFCGGSTLLLALLALFLGMMVSSCGTTDLFGAVVGGSCSCEGFIGRRGRRSVSFVGQC